MANNRARPVEASAIQTFAAIIIFLRLQRSIRTPVKGPRKTMGSRPANVAPVNTAADPVDWVKYQINAKETNWLPNRENAWLVHRKKNRETQPGFPVKISSPSVAFMTTANGEPREADYLSNDILIVQEKFNSRITKLHGHSIQEILPQFKYIN